MKELLEEMQKKKAAEAVGGKVQSSKAEVGSKQKAAASRSVADTKVAAALPSSQQPKAQLQAKTAVAPKAAASTGKRPAASADGPKSGTQKKKAKGS